MGIQIDVRESGAGRTDAPFIYGLSEANFTRSLFASLFSFEGEERRAGGSVMIAFYGRGDQPRGFCRHSATAYHDHRFTRRWACQFLPMAMGLGGRVLG